MRNQKRLIRRRTVDHLRTASALCRTVPLAPLPSPHPYQEHLMTAPTDDRQAPLPSIPDQDPPTVRLPKPTRDDKRSEIVTRLLDSLEDLVTRHRALAGDASEVELHAELIAAEVAHELSVTRSALRRNPPLRKKS